MRVDPPVAPWDEPPDPGVLRVPAEYVDAANELRLVLLRARRRDPIGERRDRIPGARAPREGYGLASRREERSPDSEAHP